MKRQKICKGCYNSTYDISPTSRQGLVLTLIKSEPTLHSILPCPPHDTEQLLRDAEVLRARASSPPDAPARVGLGCEGLLQLDQEAKPLDCGEFQADGRWLYECQT